MTAVADRVQAERNRGTVRCEHSNAGRRRRATRGSARLRAGPYGPSAVVLLISRSQWNALT